MQRGEPWFDRDGLKAQQAKLTYPLTYLDFETVNPAIPRFTGTHPYQQIPFQWSAHIQHRPGAEPQHYDFLATDPSDPRREFVTSLFAALPETGSTIVYNQQFESRDLTNSLLHCRNLLSGSRTFKLASLICCPSSEIAFIIPRSRGRTA